MYVKEYTAWIDKNETFSQVIKKAIAAQQAATYAPYIELPYYVGNSTNGGCKIPIIKYKL